VVTKVKNADAFYFEGGSPQYLLDQIKMAGLDQLFTSELSDKVYVGCSAGSNILGEAVIKSSKTDPKGYGSFEGLKLVNFSIRPHYMRQDRMQFDDSVIQGFAKEFNSTFYAIDDNSAIAVENGNIEIVSEGQWKKFDK
jgi:dipeptidase E